METVVKLIQSTESKIIIVYKKIKIINIYIKNSYTEILQDYINLYANEKISDFFIFGEIDETSIKILTSLSKFDIKKVKYMQVKLSDSHNGFVVIDGISKLINSNLANNITTTTNNITTNANNITTNANTQNINRHFNNEKAYRKVFLTEINLESNDYLIKKNVYTPTIGDIKNDIKKIKNYIEEKKLIFPKINFKDITKKDIKKLKNFIYSTINKRYNNHTINIFINHLTI